MLTPLEASDARTATALLREGFPQRSPRFWAEALARLARHPGNRLADQPLGYLLWDASEPVGVALTVGCVRVGQDGGRVRRVNVSSWYIRATHRWRAGLMLRRLFADPHTVYTDLTPTPEVRRILPAFGLQAMNRGVQIDLLPSHLGRAWRTRRAQVLPEGRDWLACGLSAEVLDAHRALGCLPLLLPHAQGDDLVVVRPKRLRGVPAARVVFAQSNARLAEGLAALAPPLLARGMLCLESDCRAPQDRASRGWFRPRDVWFARGDAFEDRTDHLSSEICLFDH